MEGGLWLVDPKLWNKVLLGRMLWKIINCPSSSLWSNWIRSTKCKATPIMQLDIKDNMAWSWRGLLKLRPTLSSVISSSGYYCIERYDELRQVGSIVECHNLIWTSGISKHNFINWLICGERLQIIEITSRWMPSIDI